MADQEEQSQCSPSAWAWGLQAIDSKVVLSWREHLREGCQAQGLRNMGIWQRSWKHPCSKLCCFSPDCASQRCSSCARGISRVRGDRAVCMSCDLRFTDEDPATSNCYDMVGYQLCKSCLLDPSTLHEHSDFCVVDGATGNHFGVQRGCGIAPRHAYLPEMCIQVSGDASEMVCSICFCDFDEPDNPACAWPGCRAKPPHKVDTRRDMKSQSGLAEGTSFAHRDCLMQWILVQSLSFCAPSDAGSSSPLVSPPPLCPACQWEAEAAKWKMEFAAGVRLVVAAFDGIAAAGKQTIAAEASARLFTEVAAEAEVDPGISEIARQQAPLDLAEALTCLQRGTEELHPQAAIRAIMANLCEDVLSGTFQVQAT
eukprot:TRINITY_DN20213_c0_g1_i1.p1 TRINITY_DN20213_c0_g1~~TRINITY_DN20213_c0_g1_i1.p1  ORF type:complete len:379 (-),score=65.48 TRINITY_DN20213_c0_g1_i1:180-1286(-)